MAEAAADQESLITQFCVLTGSEIHEARQYLETHDWDLSYSAAEYYAALEQGRLNDPIHDPINGGLEESNVEAAAAAAAAFPQSLPDHVGADSTEDRSRSGSGLVAQPLPSTSAAHPPPPPGKPKSKQPQKKFATLGDLGGGTRGGAHDDDDDSDSDYKDENQDLFAGGEKSGLAVQNPDEMKRKIIAKAKKDAKKPQGGAQTPQARLSQFTGTARTLGGDDTPSEIIDDPAANIPGPAPRVSRTLHFWEDGFSVDDGQLYRQDDPANAGYLHMIRTGRAPIDIMNVKKGQEVDVKLEQHVEKYKPKKQKFKAFAGGGQRLGSPTPGGAGNGEASDHAGTALAASNVSESSAVTAPVVDINESQPTVTLQIRLGDGARLTSRFNTSHTIGDVYSFVRASNTASQAREWVLMTTFPSKELSDKAAILGDLSDFKRGGVVVQRWS